MQTDNGPARIRVNVQQMSRWNVTADNVREYDSIMRNGGEVLTLDARPYVERLCEFSIFYTLTK